MGCEQQERDDRKRRNRARAKARSTFYRHADRFIGEGIAQSRDEFSALYGWTIDQMEHDIEHAFKNGCPYCHQPFRDMPHGLADLTLDIVDPYPAKLPYYTTNVRWVCSTCNKEKQRTPPEYWGAKLVAWEQWRQLQEKREDDPFAGLPLFSWAAKENEVWQPILS